MSLARQTATPSRDVLVTEVKRLRQRVSDLESAAPDAVSIQDDEGTERVRLGLQDDGSYGIRVYNATGTQIFDQTA